MGERHGWIRPVTRFAKHYQKKTERHWGLVWHYVRHILKREGLFCSKDFPLITRYQASNALGKLEKRGEVEQVGWIYLPGLGQRLNLYVKVKP